MDAWILYSAASALGAAATGFALKGALERGGVLLSTIAFRLVAGLVLAGIAMAGQPFEPTYRYVFLTGLVLPLEVLGMVCMSLALRSGQLSLVQPLLGFIPLLVVIADAAVSREVPTPAAALGIVLVVSGVYGMGVRRGASLWEPLVSLARAKASRYAAGAVVFWSVATAMHSHGIEQVGAFAWSSTVVLGSALLLVPVLFVVRLETGSLGAPDRLRAWVGWVVVAGGCFAAEQAGLHVSLGMAPAGYVSAVKALSVMASVALGLAFLGERENVRGRVAGGVLITLGVGLVAVFG